MEREEVHYFDSQNDWRLKLSDKTTRETARPVVRTLGCLALAILQAGAVIREGLCDMDEYCDIYSLRRKELLRQKAVPGVRLPAHRAHDAGDLTPHDRGRRCVGRDRVAASLQLSPS